MKRFFILFISLLIVVFDSIGQGSRVLAPNYPGTAALAAPNATPNANNDDFAWLEHDAADSDDFLDPDAPAAERVFVYLRAGETLRYGIRRIAVRYDQTNPYSSAAIEGNNQDLTIIIYDNGGTIRQATHFDTDVASSGDATLLTSNGAGTDGIIGTVAESLLGPEFVFNSITYNTGGYEPREYTNNTGSDQAFYIAFLQDDYAFTTEGQLITDITAVTISDVDIRSWYDLWDFTVYNGNQEKKGRVYSQRWSFTAQDFENLFADEMELYAVIPSTISGVNSGNYIKQIDLGGIDPFSAIVYAGSTGADLGSVTDTNGDGNIDFLDARQSQNTDIGNIEYNIFLQNPDVSLYPTTTLPTISISNAVFYCNNQGTGGEGTIFFNSNQTGFIAVLVDLNGVSGYQDGTEDIIIEQEVTVIGDQVLRWDGLDGNNDFVTSGTEITISGRFTSGPLHVPLFDVEENDAGINMLDVRPSTSFDLIYWDDSALGGTGANPQVELDGTNTGTHLWTDGDTDLLNTWSYGFYQINTEIVSFSYVCDSDGDGVDDNVDLDSDNDGLTDVNEGNFRGDADGDNIPDYVDIDFAGFVDANGDGINDNFDFDMDGVPNAIDLDSDNDGIPDVIEFGLVDADNDGTLDEGSGITDLNGNGLDDAYDGDCTGAGSSGSGNATAVFSSANFTNPGNATGASNFTSATSTTRGATIVMNMGASIPSGQDITITIATSAAGDGSVILIEQSTDGTDFSTPNQQYFITSTPGFYENITYKPTIDAQYLRFTISERPGGTFFLDALSYNYNIAACAAAADLVALNTDGDGVANYLDLDSDNDGIVDIIEAGGTAGSDGRISSFTDSNGNGRNDDEEEIGLDIPDTDADGSIPDYLDIDSDNDGILDNVEAQASDIYIASSATDTDGNGLYDVYDPNNGGTLINPVDTDSDDIDDYLSSDSDGDGVDDFIEGWDSDRDGFSNLDTDEDQLISDETGYNVDTDTDGLWDIYEASPAPTPNTDASGKSNWQDTDDDNDGILTSGEDANSNNDWTDDKTQGQGGGADVPDYLFRGDYDGDSVADIDDADSDNDGILDSDEDNGETIDPSGDEDGDGIANYQDATDGAVTGGLSSTADTNGDGTYDVYDSDLDGIPDFLDLDSDNDGLWDAIEADGGSVPNGLNTTTGQFELQDPDNDGLMNYVDTDDVTTGGVSDLANPDSDGDGLKDYRDIDSDGDGITDIIESQSQAGFIALTNLDNDGDGIDNAFDPSDGGVLLDPLNSDGLDTRDYLDSDSDNDGVSDAIEGDDVDQDGYGDWDANNNHIVDDAGFNVDTDGDGLADIFDTVTLGSAGNATGSSSDLQNTDGIDLRNWRDSDDDNDGIPTEDEDANSNGNFADDLNDDPAGLIPNYLFYGDFDGDGIPDANDSDSDNDGIPDSEEDGGEGVDPSADADGDGIPNYKDSDDPGLSSTVDSNGDGVYDVYDADLDGIPDFRDRDSDNDGMPDLIEAGGIDADGDGEVDGNTDTDGDGIPDNVDVNQTGGVDSDADGIDDAFDFSVSGGTDTDGDDIIDSADLDIDGDGILNTYDTDNGGIALIPIDSDGDGINDLYDLDSDNDGIPDVIEAGGVDANGDGKLDDITDTDLDGFADLIDIDNGGTALTIPDSDGDGEVDYLDLDSDNDGITDAVDNGGTDTNGDGLIDGFANDADGDGLADVVDPDSGGTPIANVDTDGDGLSDYQDLDSDNDGYQDILEGGGVDTDNDGVVDNYADSDDDDIPDTVDVDNSGTNGGSGIDSDGDGIDNTFDVDTTLGTDTDGDSIDDAFDTDVDGDGLDDNVEINPYSIRDTDGDGNKNFRDLDSDNDGIPDVTEFGGLTTDAATGSIASFTDANTNGWNDAQEASVITPVNSDGDALSIGDYRDLDSDNDGIVDNVEAQTKLTYISISGNDTDNDGLDDAYDPNNGGTLIDPSNVNTDGVGENDVLDLDSDGDNVLDRLEGDNADRNQFADWDANNNGNFDDTGFNSDVDSDGILDIYDTYSGSGSSQVLGSSSSHQDTDFDSIWDFQDTDDDGDGLLTSSQGGGNEDSDSDGDPTNDFDDDANSIIPNYLFGNDDADGDGIVNSLDDDSDNDGLADFNEDGGTGIDPSGDIDGDGLPNYQDADMDGDGVANTSESGTFAFTDSNNDGTIDIFDYDRDGVPDFLDVDSDNDGIPDVLELGLTDGDEDARLDAITDANGNGLEDAYDPGCVNITGGTFSGNATSVFSENGLTNAGTNATGAADDTGTFLDSSTDFLVVDFGTTIIADQNVTIRVGASTTGGQLTIDQSTDGTNFSNIRTLPTTAAWVNNTYTLTADAQYIRVRLSVDPGGFHGVDALSYNYTVAGGNPCGVTGTELATTDTDADNIPDHQDLDSDNDGISDNVEAQPTATYVAPVALDSDGDGLFDVYDEDISAGNAIDPENTDGADNDDYIDTDSDNDGVLDFVEAYDANMDGYSKLDKDKDGLISDQTGYSSDVDADGIRLIFDNVNGRGTVANITGTKADRQDTDGDTIEDWRDIDDDGDGTDTGDGTPGSGEDTNANGNWADDFTQGGGTTPNYLYNADSDDDGVSDDVDFDSDNDGIFDINEFASTLPSPFADDDEDGTYNYLDADNTGFSDVNGDGVDDQYDKDRDGIPNFFDLDSDDDGIADIVEGAGLTDSDNDGRVDSFTDGGNGEDATLNYTEASMSSNGGGDGVGNPANASSLSSGNAILNRTGEYLVMDLGAVYPAGTIISVYARVNAGGVNNNDLKISESELVSVYSDLAFTNDKTFSSLSNTTHRDFVFELSADAQYIGIENLLRSGGAIQVDGLYFNTDTPEDFDTDGLDDFLDIDSDNDGLTDHLEAHTTASLTAPSGLDTDEDGLDDAFDGDNGGTVPPITNTDGDAEPDYRDIDSDNDNDGDGVLYDYIEGYDANRNGFSELDSNADGSIADESGYNVDTDGDGLWDIFDSYSGRGSANITGTFADVQDSDSDGRPDFRDQDDDGDALTTAVEDVDNDGDWTNDKTQGGGATPDYLYFNDTDGDRVADGQDQDGDNDGILDDDEYDATTYRDPFGDQDTDGIFNYNDSDDPTDLGGSPLVDSNGDGIWDAYDWDLDGNPNFFDLDSDNDGIQDILEAGGVDADNDGKLDGTTDTDGDGIFDNVDVDQTGGTDADFDGIDDSFQDGTDTDGDGIEDTADLDIDGDGIINSIDADDGGTPLSNPDTDGDGIRNALDYDSDNDGILDIIEAGGADSNGDGKLDSFGDTDGDGWGNSMDSDNGGTAHPMHDSDGDSAEDYIEIDADSEASPDWGEGFDDDEDGDYLDDYESRRSTYETANGSPGHYPTTDVGPANGTPDYLDDADADGTPNFLDPDNGTYYRDSDADGIVDFFDPSNNGTRYAGVSGAPDNDGDGLPNYRDDSFAAPLPLDWLSFEATYVKGDVDLIWVTTNEVNVSHFDIEHSIDGESFKVIDVIEAYNSTGINTYTTTHLSPVVGINYYRVNQVDFDGKSEYSWIRAVTASANKISFIVYPNPTSESVTIKTEAIVTGSVQLIDILGRTVWEGAFKATNKENIDLTELKAGVYQLKIVTPNGVTYKRIVKKD
jgi:large repetitive protein